LTGRRGDDPSELSLGLIEGHVATLLRLEVLHDSAKAGKLSLTLLVGAVIEFLLVWTIISLS
jgi:hypothetical protein